MNARRARAEREIDVLDGNGVRLEAGELRGFDEAVHGSVIWHFRGCGRGPTWAVRAHTRVEFGLDDGRHRIRTDFASRAGKTDQNGGSGRFAQCRPWPVGPRRIPGPLAKILGNQV